MILRRIVSWLVLVGIFIMLAYVAGSARAATGDVVITQRTSTGYEPITLADPNADRIVFWDDSAGRWVYLTLGTGLSITGTTISATASGGTWGSITGTLSAQTDLQTALDAKLGTASAAAAYHPLNGNSTGNAATATALATGRTLSITGDMAWTSPIFDGSGNVTAAGTLATVATAGTTGSSTAIPVITINAKGLTTSITTAAVVAPAGTLTGTALASNVVTSSLTSVGIGTLGTLALQSATNIALSGQSLTGSQATNLLDLSTTWNTTGSPAGIKLNLTDTASASGSRFLDFTVQGNNQAAAIAKATAASTIGPIFASKSAASNDWAGFYGGSSYELFFFAESPTLVTTTVQSKKIAMLRHALGLSINGTEYFGWASSTVGSFPDTRLYRDGAANIIAQRNDTNAQTKRIYGTYANSGADYVRGSLAATTSAFTIAAETAGTGADDIDLALTPAGTGGVKIGGGAGIKSVLSAAAALDFGAIAVGSSEDLTITVTGAALGDVVVMGFPSAVSDGLIFKAFVSATNTVTVRAMNEGGGAVNPASATYRATVIRH